LKRKYKHGIWGSNTAVFRDNLIKGLQERTLGRFYAPFKVLVAENQTRITLWNISNCCCKV